MCEEIMEHIKVLYIESVNSNSFLKRYLSRLSEHKFLNLHSIAKDIKNGGRHSSVISMENANITITINKYCDYALLLNQVFISSNFFDSFCKKEIETLFGLPFNIVIKHLTIKHLFDEANDELIRLLADRLNKNYQSHTDFVVVHSINNPPFAYKGTLLFNKKIPKERNSVPKEWFLIKNQGILSHDRDIYGCWLVIKTLELRTGIKKVFYKTTDSAKQALIWLSEPLTRHGPEAEKLIFDLRTLLSTNDPEIKAALLEIESANNSLLNLVEDYDYPRNWVSLDKIQSRFMQSKN